jgi:oxygen-independent coproporphyrinogen-3 oxidase
MNPYEALVAHPLFSQRTIDYIRWYPKSLTPSAQMHWGDAAQRGLEGVYIHVPFCDQLCPFCPYNKRTSDDAMISDYVQALLREIALYGDRIQKTPLRFIYFGGGTPSVLTPSQLESILDALHSHFGFQEGVEICVEAHPTHLTRPYVTAMAGLGVNRVSSGIQAFDDALLKRLGANHTVAQALQAIDETVGAIGHIAIDLLYRCPGQTVDHWLEQFQHAISIPGVDHLSCYSLVLDNDAEQPSPVEEGRMMTDMLALAESAGYRHYASCASGGFDLCKPGREGIYEARHWEAPQARFLGLGPGALGFVGNSVTVNGLGVRRYIERLNQGQLPLVSATHAHQEELMRRYFVLGVKTLNVPLEPFRQEFGIEPTEYFQMEFDQLQRWGFIALSQDFLSLTPLGRLFVDTVSAVFFSQGQREVPHPEEPEIRAAELEAIRLSGVAPRDLCLSA